MLNIKALRATHNVQALTHYLHDSLHRTLHEFSDLDLLPPRLTLDGLGVRVCVAGRWLSTRDPVIPTGVGVVAVRESRQRRAFSRLGGETCGHEPVVVHPLVY